MRSDIDVRLIRELDAAELHQLLELFELAEFTAPGDDGRWLAAMLQGSLLAAGAFTPDGQLIGFARALGDGASDAYLQDVTVAAAWRKQGIGGRLVRLLVDELTRRGIDWIGLAATPGNAEFYERLGFERLAGFTPMCFKRPPTDSE